MIAFIGSPLDRADNTRANPEALAALTDWRARLLLLDGLMPSMDERGGLVWGSLADASQDAELVFLGIETSESGTPRACFAAVPPAGDASPRIANPALWQVMASLAPPDLALYGGARSICDWHARHRFCSTCGGPTRIAKGGWQRGCASCGAQHFPRVDPVTIMLIENQGRLMLGRGLGWPEGRFSTLAGFVEPGESIEEAVAREVLEESGLRVRDVQYVASQPWPFPSQLMLGCHARTDDENVVLDTTELAEGRWFTRDQVAAAVAGDTGAPFIAPPPHAIANHLMQWWLER
jgi:NAD+ diphosphatase